MKKFDYKKSILGFLIAFFTPTVIAFLLSFILSMIFSIFFSFQGLDATAVTEKITLFSEKYYLDYIINVLSYLGGIILALLFMGKEEIKKILSSFKNPKTYFWGFLIGALMIVFSYTYSALTASLIKDSVNENQASIIDYIKNNYFLAFLYVVILAPIAEELAFRYFVFGEAKKCNKLIAYLVSGLLFAGAHYIALIGAKDINWLAELVALPSYLLPGLLFCLAYDKTDSIAAPLIMHALNNIISFVLIII